MLYFIAEKYSQPFINDYNKIYFILKGGLIVLTCYLTIAAVIYQPFLFSGLLSVSDIAFATGDGDGKRYNGPLHGGGSSERVKYCTFNENLKAPLCVGTSKSDIIIGTLQDDFIKGKGADDALQGRTGDDDVFGNKGNDDIQGGVGNDNIYGQDGNDLMYGGPGEDFMVGGKDDDDLYAGLGEDILEGGPGKNYFDCGDGYDIIIDFDPSNDIASNNCEDVRIGL